MPQFAKTRSNLLVGGLSLQADVVLLPKGAGMFTAKVTIVLLGNCCPGFIRVEDAMEWSSNSMRSKGRQSHIGNKEKEAGESKKHRRMIFLVIIQFSVYYVELKEMKKNLCCHSNPFVKLFVFKRGVG